MGATLGMINSDVRTKSSSRSSYSSWPMTVTYCDTHGAYPAEERTGRYGADKRRYTSKQTCHGVLDDREGYGMEVEFLLAKDTKKMFGGDKRSYCVLVPLRRLVCLGRDLLFLFFCFWKERK